MCRIAGLLGAPSSLTALLRDPPHSLIEQARSPRELPPGVVGSDGFGVGWFAEHDGVPAFFRSTLPVWADTHVESMAPHIRSRCIVASSRTASRTMAVAITNTPPFPAGRALLVHNGTIDDFHARVLEPLRAQLAPATRAALAGNTDSEYVAALLGDQPDGALSDRVAAMLVTVTASVRAAGVAAQLNVIVGDGHTMVATRYAVDTAAPSLWMREDARGIAFASEAMEDHGWSEVPVGAMVEARLHDGRVTTTHSTIAG